MLLLDPDERVLLFRGHRETTGEPFWFSVGGGTEPGEAPEETALRELREETGLTGAVLGPEVWRRDRIVPWRGAPHLFRERYYLARTECTAVDTSGFTEEERRTVTAHRWWSRAALARTAEHLAPPDLAERLAALLDHGPPQEPIRLPR